MATIKHLSCDIETTSSVNLASSGVYKYAEAGDFEILLFGYSIDHQPPQVVDLKHGEQIPVEVLRALVDPGVTKSAFNATFERVCLSAYLRKHYPDLLTQSPHNLSHYRHMPAPYPQDNPHIPAPNAPYSHPRAHDAELVTQYRDQCTQYPDMIGQCSDSVRPSPDMLEGGFLSAQSWRCSMVACAYLGLPQSLEAAARVLGLKAQKDSAGKRLIRKYCTPQPQSPQADALPVIDPDWRAFVEYCRQDVAVEVAIQQRLGAYEVPVSEWDAYVLDQKINDTGIVLDLPLVDQAIACDQAHREQALARAKVLTGLDNPNSPLQLKAWLQEHDCHVESLTKADVAKALKDADGVVREVLTLRGDLAKSSVKKYQAMRNVAGTDKRGRGLIQFYGAGRTGRFAGRLVQVQNLPRNYLPDLAHARALLRSGDHDALELLYGSVPDTLSQLIRTAFIPAPGHRFVVADFSAIEARVIAWLAGEQWRLELFKKGGDIYCQSASQMFGVPVEKHGKNADLRQKGKVAELACGYQGSTGALIAMGALDTGLREGELKPLVDAWRVANPNIVRLWWDVEAAVIECVITRQPQELGCLTFSIESGILFITLPSGRRLSYVKPRLATNRFGNTSVEYEGVTVNKRWGVIESYGGKFTENIVQAIARDLLIHALHTVDSVGHRIVMHVHDEIIIETNNANVDEICELMSRTPTWARGLPLDADGYECDFYMKD